MCWYSVTPTLTSMGGSLTLTPAEAIEAITNTKAQAFLISSSTTLAYGREAPCEAVREEPITDRTTSRQSADRGQAAGIGGEDQLRLQRRLPKKQPNFDSSLPKSQGHLQGWKRRLFRGT